MKKGFVSLILFVATLSFISCGNKAQDNAEAAAADSAAVEEQLQEQEVEEMSAVINGVSACLDSIQIQEHMIFNAEEGSTDKKQVLARLSDFKNLLARKQAEINALMAKNKNMSESSKKTIQNLQKMVDYLNDQLTAKDKQIGQLQESLSQKDAKIDEFRYNMNELSNESDYLKEQNYQQDKQLNTVYCLIGTSKELKAAGVLKGNIFSKKINNDNIDAKLFKKLDKRSCKEISIPSSSPKIRTNNPTSSYTLTKNDDGTSTLQITNPDQFWGVSPYLVIQE